MRLNLLFGFLVTISISGCAGDTTELMDEGRACLISTPDPFDTQTFVEGEAAQVHVMFDECLGCEREMRASCSVELIDGVLEVSGDASYRPPGRGACAAVCVALEAVCDTPPLPAGSIVLEYGAGSTSVTVPATQIDAPCVDG